MKKWIVCICLILLLSITSVSASEDANQTIQSNTNENIDDIVLSSSNLAEADTLNVPANESVDVLTATEGDTLSASNWYVNASVDENGNGTIESPYKDIATLLADDNLADGDTVYIAPGTYSGTSNVNLTIYNSLTFVNTSDGEVIFDAENLSRIFTINSSEFGFYGITFKNGKSDKGAAIYATNTVLNIASCSFINNNADEMGGALYTENSNVIATGSLFLNNNAADGAVMAAYSENETDHIFNFHTCVILNNTSSNDNPTIFYVRENEGTYYGKYSLNENWWGNTGDNANNLSEIISSVPVNSILNNWLYLTVNTPSSFVENETRIITYSLNNLATNETNDTCDPLNLKGITFDAFAEDGKVNSVSPVFQGMFDVSYTSGQPGVTDLTVKYADIEYATPVKVAPEDSFTALQNLIYSSTDVVNLTRNYRYYEEYDEGRISLYNRLTINGNDFVIDGYNSTGIFEILEGGCVLNNIAFKNGNADRGGAIFHNGGTLTVNDCSFDNNFALSEGGAFFNDEGNVIFNLCTFTQNSASQGGAFKGYAGDGNITFINCNFENNTAFSAAALYLTYGREDTIINCTFINNRAVGDGVIRKESSDSLIISDSQFFYNSADKGVIYRPEGGVTDVSGSLFVDNKGDDVSLISLGREGSAFIYDSVILHGNTTLAYALDNTSISLNYNWFGNNASNRNEKIVDEGNAVLTDWLYLDIDNNPGMIFENETYTVTFSLNHAANADMSYGYDASNLPFIPFNVTSSSQLNDVSIEDAEVLVNFTSTQYGEVEVTLSYMNASFTQVFLSAAIDSFSSLQRIIDQSPDRIVNLTMNYHYYNETDGWLVNGMTIDDSIIINGGNFSIDGSSLARIFDVSDSVVVLNDVTLKNGNTSGNGGAICSSNSKYILNNCNFINNFASGNGGAIYADSIDNCVFGGEFINNTANNGGAIYAVTISESSFTGLFENNSAITNGAVLFTENDASDITTNGTFIGNEANYGGVFYFKGNSEDNIFEGEFINNSANYGGVFYFYRQSTNDIIDALFMGNIANQSGAVADFKSTVSYGDFTGSFINNIAKKNGAAFYFENNVDNTNISGVFEDNEGRLGSVIYFTGSSVNNTVNGSFVNNLGNSVIYIRGKSNFTTIIGEFINNTATVGSVIFFNDDANHDTVSGTFMNNIANINGAVLYFNKLANENSISGNYSNNNATNGGVIYFNGPSVLNYIEGNFDNNTATNGGVLYFNGKALANGIDGNFSNNTALNDGAVAYFNGNASGITFDGCYADNTAMNNGGVFHFNNIDYTGFMGYYYNNSAMNTGAVIDVSGDSTGNRIDGRFIDNTAEDSIINMGSACNNNSICGLFLGNTIYDESGVVSISNGNDNEVFESIFIDNAGYDIISTNATVNAYENWFGNNASNYNETPNVNGNVTLNNWLYLNATVEKEELDDYDVIFSLSMFENNTTKDFDDSLMPIVDLLITPTNGTVNYEVAGLDSTVVYHPTEGTHATVTATVRDTSFTYGFDVTNKTNVNLSAVADTIAYLDNATIVLSYAENATGKVNITVTGVRSNGDDFIYKVQEDINATHIVSGLEAGEYNITVLYLGDDAYWSSLATTNLTVIKANLTINLTGESEITPKDTQIINVAINDDIDGNLTVYINGELSDVIVNDGKITLSNLDMGEYLIEVKLTDDHNYNDAVGNFTFKVVSCEYNITVDISDIILDEDLSFNVTLPKDANGTITYIIGNESTTIDVDGTIVGDNIVVPVTVSDLGVGDYNITVIYNGNKYYEASNVTANFTVFRKYSPIEVTNNDENVTINLPENATGEVIVEVNGEALGNFTVENGTVIVPIDNFKPGNYSLNITYEGDEIYNTNSTVYDFTIERFDPMATINVTDNVVTLNLPSDATGTVNVTVNGTDYAVVDVINGTASIVIDKELGNYTVSMNYSGDNVYLDCVNSTDIELIKINPDINITVTDINVTDTDALVVSIVLPGDATGNVTVTIGNITETIDINSSTVRGMNGILVMSILNDNMSAGTYPVTVTYNGDDKYYPSTDEGILNIYKLNLTTDITCVDNILNVTLPKDAEGNMTLVVDNETFISPIVDGVASFDLNDMPLGFYNGTLSYPGSDIYNEFESVIPVTVDGIIVSVDDLTKYYGGNETLDVNVTDVYGKPVTNKTVTYTINGKNYTRTTSDKGIASMSIKLAAGDYNITVTVDDVVSDVHVAVLSTISAPDIVKYFKNGTQFYATFLDSEGNYLPDDTAVSFNINGVNYTRKITGGEGKAKLNINLPAGEYIITSTNPVTGDLKASNITVLSKLVNNTDIVKYFRNGTQYCVTVVDDNGNPVGAGVNVTFNINGVFYTRKTNDEGVAKLNINLPEGNYTITAEYEGCYVSNNIEVLPVLYADDLVKKYGEADLFIIKLVDGQGNPYANQTVMFNINGVLYSRVTDINGQAGLPIRLPVGKYIITSTYNGSSIANEITVTN